MSLVYHKNIYMIAGEASGDQLGAWLINQLKMVYPHVHFHGVGGGEMHQAGQSQVFDAEKLSYFGFTEVAKNLYKIYKQRKMVVEDIRKIQPHVLITIDLPDFNFSVGRFAKRLGIPVIHIGAPTVWAWRPKRAEKLSHFLSSLLCLFPFEPQYFMRHKLPSFFIGHPIAHKKLSVKPKRTPPYSLLLLPGSRKSEVRILLPLMLQAVGVLKEKYPDLQVQIVQMEGTMSLARNLVTKLGFQNTVLFVEASKKYQTMQEATLALAASGTVTLDLALCHTPMVIIYKVDALSGFLARFLLRTRMVGLPNIIMNRLIAPELLQNNCTVQNMVREIDRLLKNKPSLEHQENDLIRVVERLKIEQDSLTKTWHKIFDPILGFHLE